MEEVIKPIFELITSFVSVFLLLLLAIILKITHAVISPNLEYVSMAIEIAGNILNKLPALF